MSRLFAYCRVSTAEQNTENQIQAIAARGFDIKKNRVIEEKVSGSVHAMSRPEFKNMVENKLEEGDTLIVLKLDRLGRDNIDVQATIELLMGMGVRVVSLDLPVEDLASSEGRLMLQMFSAFAEFERNRIRERTAEGQARARKEGKTIGRPTGSKAVEKVQALKQQNLSQAAVAKELQIGIATVKRHWNPKS